MHGNVGDERVWLTDQAGAGVRFASPQLCIPDHVGSVTCLVPDTTVVGGWFATADGMVVSDARFRNTSHR